MAVELGKFTPEDIDVENTPRMDLSRSISRQDNENFQDAVKSPEEKMVLEMIGRAEHHLDVRAAEQSIELGGAENRKGLLEASKDFFRFVYVQTYVKSAGVVLSTVTNPHLNKFFGDPPDTAPEVIACAVAIAGPPLVDLLKNRGGV